MTREEVIQRLRLNQARHLPLAALARKAGLDRETLRNAVCYGYLSERSKTAVERAILAAEKEGFYIPRS